METSCFNKHSCATLLNAALWQYPQIRRHLFFSIPTNLCWLLLTRLTQIHVIRTAFRRFYEGNHNGNKAKMKLLKFDGRISSMFCFANSMLLITYLFSERHNESEDGTWLCVMYIFVQYASCPLQQLIRTTRY